MNADQQSHVVIAPSWREDCGFELTGRDSACEVRRPPDDVCLLFVFLDDVRRSGLCLVGILSGAPQGAALAKQVPTAV